MFVLTVDQKGSRSDRDRVPDALKKLADIPTLAPFERTVGDEIQGVLTTADGVYQAIYRLVRDGHWHIGLGIGQGEFPDSSHPRSSEGRGEAFIAARNAVESAKELTPSLTLSVNTHSSDPATTPEDVVPARALARLLASIIESRTPRQWEVLDAVKSVPTLIQAGELLGVSTSAVSQSLVASRAALENEAQAGLRYLLEELDTRYSREDT